MIFILASQKKGDASTNIPVWVIGLVAAGIAIAASFLIWKDGLLGPITSVLNIFNFLLKIGDKVF